MLIIKLKYNKAKAKAKAKSKAKAEAAAAEEARKVQRQAVAKAQRALCKAHGTVSLRGLVMVCV